MVKESQENRTGLACCGSTASTYLLAPGLGSSHTTSLFSCFLMPQYQEECRSVKHVLFSAWPDHQTPESAGPLLRLVAEVESPEAAANSGPIVVHCR